MRLKELHGLPVIDPTAARRVGTVADYQVDPVGGRIAALDLDPGGQSDVKERILGHRIRRVGRHAVVLTLQGGSGPTAPADVNERWLDTSSLVGLEVIGDDGDRIGRLADATFDQDSLEIQHYTLRSATFIEDLTSGRGRIQPSRVHSCSRELMIVESGKLQQEQPLPADEPPVEEKPMAEDKPTARNDTLGVPLKVEDKVPAPSASNVEDGHPVTPRR
jgi:uncharacterized protein YrrD